MCETTNVNWPPRLQSVQSDSCKYSCKSHKMTGGHTSRQFDGRDGYCQFDCVSNCQIMSLVCQERWWGIGIPGFERWNHSNGGWWWWWLKRTDNTVYKHWILLGLGRHEPQMKDLPAYSFKNKQAQTAEWDKNTHVHKNRKVNASWWIILIKHRNQ